MDIPLMLRAWVGADGSASRAAVSNLWSSLFHQGDLHPTAAIVGPFFVEALQSGSDAVFADAYFFLDHMLDPMTPAWEADGFTPDQHESPPCYWVAASALDVLLTCLEPGSSARLSSMLDPALISRQVAQTLWFPQSADEIVDALRRRLDSEADPMERTPLLLCLAMQNRHLADPADYRRFARAGHAHHPGERLAGVMALARIRQLAIDGDDFDLLRSALDGPVELGYPIEDTHGSFGHRGATRLRRASSCGSPRQSGGCRVDRAAVRGD